MAHANRNQTGCQSRAFTLVELLVVIGIIALLISILLPTLNRARESAKTIKCASNLRTIGQGLAIYVAEYKQAYPASYIYAGMNMPPNEGPSAAVHGYIHWSSFLYSRKDALAATGNTAGDAFDAHNVPAFLNLSGWDAFQCPDIPNGGLPPCNTYNDNLDFGQQNDDPGIVDFQAPRCAYTLNEAICPRNKFEVGFQGAIRSFHFVRAQQVKHTSTTILGTEFAQDWHIVAGPPRVDTTNTGNDTVCKSHRPVHGFYAVLPANGNPGDIDQAGLGTGFGRTTLAVLEMTADKLNPNPTYPLPGNGNRLDWVGRNHGQRKLDAKGYDTRLSNFLYADGHVETKNIRDTLTPFQWGDRFYSLDQGADVQSLGQ